MSEWLDRFKFWEGEEAKCGKEPRINVVSTVNALRKIYEVFPSPLTLQAIIQAAGVNMSNKLLSIYDDLLDEVVEVNVVIKKRKLAAWREDLAHLQGEAAFAVAEIRTFVADYGPNYEDWPAAERDNFFSSIGPYERWIGKGEGGALPLLYIPFTLYNQICEYVNWRKEHPWGWPPNAISEVMLEVDDQVQKVPEWADEKIIAAAGDAYEKGKTAVGAAAEGIAKGAKDLVEVIVHGVSKGIGGAWIPIVLLGTIGVAIVLRRKARRAA